MARDIGRTIIIASGVIGVFNAVLFIGLAAIGVLPVTVALPVVFAVNLLVGTFLGWIMATRQ